MVTDETKIDRTTYIGGSDVGAILGLDPYKSIVDVFYAKTDPTRLTPLDEDNPKFVVGNEIEGFIARMYEKQTGNLTLEYAPTIYHPEYSFLGGHVDRLILRNGGSPKLPEFDKHGLYKPSPSQLKDWGILECKNTGGIGGRTIWENGVPSYYYAQVQFYMACAQLEKADLAVLKDGWEFEVHPIPRNEDFIKNMIEKAVDFWENNVLKNIPPPAVDGEDIKLIYPKQVPGKTKTASDMIRHKVESVYNIRQQIKGLEEQKANLEFEIKQYLEDAAELLMNGSTVMTYKKDRDRSVVDLKALEKAHPDIVENFRVSRKGSRKLLFKRNYKGG
jgi:putative phage-type endonuclease